MSNTKEDDDCVCRVSFGRIGAGAAFAISASEIVSVGMVLILMGRFGRFSGAAAGVVVRGCVGLVESLSRVTFKLFGERRPGVRRTLSAAGAGANASARVAKLGREIAPHDAIGRCNIRRPETAICLNV